MVSLNNGENLPNAQARPPRILLVEDTLLVANEVARMLRGFGCEIVGPVGRLEEAKKLAAGEDLDAALLDINLDNEPVFPAAEILRGRQVPVAFLTGYTCTALPEAYHKMPCLEKPFGADELTRLLKDDFGFQPQARC